MMISPHRRQLHKSKSDASAGSSVDSVGPNTSSSPARTSNGLFSYFAQARRRWTKTPWETDTLLPTTYSSTVTPFHTSSSVNNNNNINNNHNHHHNNNNKRPTPAALTCNHFLMGGHYYPGKDKKRRHLRRKTLWYKIFCSSPLRKATSFLLLFYVLLWHVCIPTVQWVWNGAMMSNSSARSPLSNWLLYDGTLQLPPLEAEQRAALGLAASRAQLRRATKQQQWQILEAIVPVWYHRNDPETTKTKTTHHHDPPRKDPKIEPPPKSETKSKKEPIPDKETPKQQVKQDAVVVDTNKHQDGTIQIEEKVRVLHKNGDGMIQRTLHTPRKDAIQYSQCPTTENHPDTQSISVTLVTQATTSRLWILNETCTRWKDPIVAVVFIPHGQELPSITMSCSNLTILYYQGNEEESQGPNYPVNRLRNIGLDAVTTSHVFMMDIDFVPSMDLPNTIRQALQLQQEQQTDQEEPTTALVVPAFERLPPQPCDTDSACASFLQSNSSFIPPSFEALQKCFQHKDCIVFQSNNNWEGHSTTRSELWLQRQWYQQDEDQAKKNANNEPKQQQQQQPKRLVTIPCFHTARYEPYVVLPWCRRGGGGGGESPTAPYYDERFHGYGKNKIQLVSHLRKQGYRFDILPQGFIVHNPHPESSIKETWNDRQGSELHSAMDKLYTNFLGELDTIYKGQVHERSIKLCK